MPLKSGVSDGARTRDIPDHNRVLYQLSYAHHVSLLSFVEVLIVPVTFRSWILLRKSRSGSTSTPRSNLSHRPLRGDCRSSLAR